MAHRHCSFPVVNATQVGQDTIYCITNVNVLHVIASQTLSMHDNTLNLDPALRIPQRLRVRAESANVCQRQPSTEKVKHGWVDYERRSVQEAERAQRAERRSRRREEETQSPAATMSKMKLAQE